MSGPSLGYEDCFAYCEHCGYGFMDEVDYLYHADGDGVCPKCGEYFDEEEARLNEEADHCDYCGAIIWPDEDQCECGEGRSCWDEDTW